jgi:hypothetical protein
MNKNEEESIDEAREKQYSKLCPLFNGLCRKNNCVFWNEDYEECEIHIHYNIINSHSWDTIELLKKTNKLLRQQLKMLKTIQQQSTEEKR